MTMSVIKHFKIGGTTLYNNSAPKVGVPATGLQDQLSNYTVTTITLNKDLLAPNEMHFTLQRDAYKKTSDLIKFQLATNLIGKQVECKIETSRDGNTNSTLVFKGIIQVAAKRGIFVECMAYSEDSQFMGPPKSRCFTNMKLEQIVKAVCGEQGVSVNIHSCFKDMVFPYIVQYNESDYDFIVRLAKRFGAFMYYDETQHFVFGKLSGGTVQLTYPDFGKADGDHVRFEMQMGCANFRLAAYDYEKDAEMTSQLPDFDRNGSTGMYKLAATNAIPKYNDPNTPFGFYTDNPYSLPSQPANYQATLMDNYSKALLGSYSDSLVVCKFVAYRVDIHVGSIIQLKEKTGQTNVDSDVMFVKSAHLSWDIKGSPINEITAVILPQAGMDMDNIFAPYFDIDEYPRSSAQRAVVLNNVDPKKMGRVQVLFVWQKDLSDDDKKKLPWIRIAQPYGGNKKGCYILPEIGEEVMVGFEHDNMEKPFVIGTLFHNAEQDDKKQMPDEKWVETDGDNKSNEENEVKAFRTKKGHTIEIHDTKEGDGFIRIYGNNKSDKENYDIILSTDKIQKKNGENKEDYVLKSADDEAKAKEAIKEKDYKAEKLRIMVRSNGGDIMMDAGEGDIFLNAKNVHINATGDSTTHIKGKNIMKVDGDQFVDVGSNSMMVQKDQTIKVNGKDDEEYGKKITVKASDDVEFSAKSLASKTDQKTEFKAGSAAIEASQGMEVKAKTGIKLDGGTEASIKGNTTKVGGGQSTKVDGVDVAVGEVSTTVKGNVVVIDTTTGTRKGTWTDV